MGNTSPKVAHGLACKWATFLLRMAAAAAGMHGAGMLIVAGRYRQQQSTSRMSLWLWCLDADFGQTAITSQF